MKLNQIKKILLIQLGDIGDVVWTTPAIRAVKKAYEEAEVSILVREGIGLLLEGDPFLNKIFEIKSSANSFWQRWREEIKFLLDLRHEKFDLVFDLRAGDRGAILSYLSGAPLRVSLLYRRGVPFWRNRLFTHLMDPPPTNEKVRGAAEQSLKIIREWGIEADDPIPRLWLTDETKEQSINLLQREQILTDLKWVTINPFSRWAYKEWGYDKWPEIINWLWCNYDLASVIVGQSSERERAEQIINKCKGKAFNLAGRTTLRELLGILSMSLLHIGVDSGPPHIGAALGTPTIIIFGPSDWYEWAPLGEKHKVVIPDYDCVPCFKKGCNGQGRSKCLEDLPVEKVKKTVQELLNEMKQEPLIGLGKTSLQ